MRSRFIDDHRGGWPIGEQCDVLEVARNGHDAWRKRLQSPTPVDSRRRSQTTIAKI